MSRTFVTRQEHERQLRELREAHDVLCRAVAFEVDQVLLRLAALEKGEVATPSADVPDSILHLDKRAEEATVQSEKT